MAAPENNGNAIKHGGESAIKRIRAGLPLVGLAREELDSVTDKMNTEGIPALEEETALELHSIKRLFYKAALAALEREDMKAFDLYCQRFGWLASASLRAWAQVAQSRRNQGQALDYEQILAQQDDNGHS